MSSHPRGSTRAIGAQAEALAAARLEAAGLTIVARNVVIAGAELDLIARGHDGSAELYVFVEVRSRATVERGDPLETIGREKQRRIARAATAWLDRQGLSARVAVRFDAVGIVAGTGGAPPRAEWVPGAFEPG